MVNQLAPGGGNMLQWNIWTSNLCPSCKHMAEDVNNVLQCPDPLHTEYFSMQIAKMKDTLAYKHIPPLVVAIMLNIFFSTLYPLTAALKPSPLLFSSQMNLRAHKWGLLSVHW